MSNSKWSSLLYLLFKKRDDGAITTKDVAKSCGDELRFSFYLTIENSLIETLAVYLTDSFRATHNISWIDGLIC